MRLRRSILIAALLTIPAAYGPARAETDVAIATIALGRLYVLGTTDNPHTSVMLDGQFRTESDDRGIFHYQLVYHPARCIVSATIGAKTYEAVVSNCGEQASPPTSDATAAGSASPQVTPQGQAPRLVVPPSGPLETSEKRQPAEPAAPAAPERVGDTERPSPQPHARAAEPRGTAIPIRRPLPPRRPVALSKAPNRVQPKASTSQPRKPVRSQPPSGSQDDTQVN